MEYGKTLIKSVSYWMRLLGFRARLKIKTGETRIKRHETTVIEENADGYTAVIWDGVSVRRRYVRVFKFDKIEPGW